MPRKTRAILKVKVIKKEQGIQKKGSRYLRCKLCRRKFDNRVSKQAHLLVCPAKEARSCIRCEKCSKQFVYKQNYMQHLKTEHSNLKTSVPCKDCHVRCPDKETLKQHVRKVHENKKHECPDCGLLFARVGHVMRHMKQKGCGGVNAVKFGCEICDAEFTRKDNLMVHLRAMHIVNSRYDCKQCSATMKSFSRLVTHVQREHTENLCFECDTCGKSTGTKAAMVKHMEIHGEKKHSCDVCGYTTFTAEVMRRHVLTHVTDKPYKCEQCTCSFIQISQLRHHIMNKHTDQFNCGLCMEAFKKIEDYADHMRTHSAKHELMCHFKLCPVGNKVFKSTRSLSVHLKKHFNVQPEECVEHKCGVCGKEFSSEVLARRHLSTHALDRPRRCMYCVQARAYVRGQQLLRHVRKCHHDVFMAHLMHVRNVLKGDSKGRAMTCERLRKSEAESILNVMDAEAERILHGYGEGVLYGGMQGGDAGGIDIEVPPLAEETESWSSANTSLESVDKSPDKSVDKKPLLSDKQLASSLARLLEHLVDADTLARFGWPECPLNEVLEKLIESCGVAAVSNAALRDLARQLLLYVIEDEAIAAELATNTVDQVVSDILKNMAEDEQ